MRRGIWWLCLPGCLWISRAEQDGRFGDDLPAIDAQLGPPAPLLLCEDPPRTELVGTVDGAWAGESLSVALEVDGVSVALPSVVAGPEVGGRAEVRIPVEAQSLGPAALACPEVCQVQATVGVASGLAVDVVEVALTVVADAPPEVSSAVLEDADGIGVDVAEVALEAPELGVRASAYPALVATLTDPQLAVAGGGTRSWLACPDGVAPAVDEPACRALAGTEAPAGPGAVLVALDTETLAALSCGGEGEPWGVSLVVEGRACLTGPALFPVVDPVPWLLDDCDADGADRELDCDDYDPDRAPSATELCGDLLDSDCDGADGDGQVSVDHLGALTPYPDLQAAIDAAVDGDGVLVCGGTHIGPFTIDASIGVEGTGATATLAGTGADSVVTIFGGVGEPGEPPEGHVELRNLEITGGGGPTGGGVDGKLESMLFEDVTVTGNAATLEGGGMLLAGKLVTLARVEVTFNEAPEGGGLAFKGSELVTLADVVVADNTADARGGGISARDAILTFVGGIIERNAAPEGSGLAVTWTMGAPPPGSPVVVTGPVVRGNFGPGAGVSLVADDVDADLTLMDAEITDHLLSGSGGGLQVTGSGGTVRIVDALVVGNTAADGGGVYADFAGKLVLGGTLRDNAATRGGGVAVDGADVVLDQLVLDGNDGDLGGGVWVGAGTVSWYGTDFLGNTAPLLGAGAGVRVTGTGSLLTCGGTDPIDDEVANDETGAPGLAPTCGETTATGAIGVAGACACSDP